MIEIARLLALPKQNHAIMQMDQATIHYWNITEHHCSQSFKRSRGRIQKAQETGFKECNMQRQHTTPYLTVMIRHVPPNAWDANRGGSRRVAWRTTRIRWRIDGIDVLKMTDKIPQVQFFDTLCIGVGCLNARECRIINAISLQQRQIGVKRAHVME